MVANGLPSLVIFEGEDYGYWSIMMRTLFCSQELWDLVEKGIPEHEDEARMKEHKKRDSNALYLIQQSLNLQLFSFIEAANTAKEAWELLRIQYQRNSKVIAVKL